MSDQLPKKHKGRKAAIYRGVKCLNCEHPLDLSDVHCSYCGQLNTTKSLSLKDFFVEFLGGVVNYDSRFWSTIKDLLFKPGIITKNYIQGKRLSYANPFRFYLSVSIISFLLQGLIATVTNSDSILNTNKFNNGLNNDENALIWNVNQDSIEKGFTKTIDSITSEKTKIANTYSTPQSYLQERKLDSLLKNLTENKKEHKIKTFEFIPEKEITKMSLFNRNIERFQLYYRFYEATNIKDPIRALDSLKHTNNKYNRWVYSKNEVFKQIENEPRRFISYIIKKIPFFIFFFTPFYAVFFWLLYSKKKYTYMEHMVFIFHIFSFVFLASIVAIIPDAIFNTTLFNGILFGLIGPFYFYKALRNFYQQPRVISVIKFITLNFVFWLSATIGALLFLITSAVVY
jgi:hypothetical protein